MRIFILTILFLQISAVFVYAQPLQNSETKCLQSLENYVHDWQKIQQARRSLSGFNLATATDIENFEDQQLAARGFAQTIDPSNFSSCPGDLSQLVSKAVLYAKRFDTACDKAIPLMRRVQAGKYISESELNQVDYQIKQAMVDWKKILPLLAREFDFQHSRINQEK